MYEHRTHPFLPRRLFLRRAGSHLLVGFGIVFASVVVGTVGYHVTGRLGWLDAFLNASMILSGEGPIDKMETSVAKMFSALYALFSGIIFIGVIGVVLAPWAHRLVHWTYLETSAKSKVQSSK
jgi:hypothetical protein